VEDIKALGVEDLDTGRPHSSHSTKPSNKPFMGHY